MFSSSGALLFLRRGRATWDGCSMNLGLRFMDTQKRVVFFPLEYVLEPRGPVSYRAPPGFLLFRRDYDRRHGARNFSAVLIMNSRAVFSLKYEVRNVRKEEN